MQMNEQRERELVNGQMNSMSSFWRFIPISLSNSYTHFSRLLWEAHDSVWYENFLCDSEDIITSFIKNSTLTESNV